MKRSDKHRNRDRLATMSGEGVPARSPFVPTGRRSAARSMPANFGGFSGDEAISALATANIPELNRAFLSKNPSVQLAALDRFCELPSGESCKYFLEPSVGESFIAKIKGMKQSRRERKLEKEKKRSLKEKFNELIVFVRLLIDSDFNVRSRAVEAITLLFQGDSKICRSLVEAGVVTFLSRSLVNSDLMIRLKVIEAVGLFLKTDGKALISMLEAGMIESLVGLLLKHHRARVSRSGVSASSQFTEIEECYEGVMLAAVMKVLIDVSKAKNIHLAKTQKKKKKGASPLEVVLPGLVCLLRENADSEDFESKYIVVNTLQILCGFSIKIYPFRGKLLELDVQTVVLKLLLRRDEQVLGDCMDLFFLFCEKSKESLSELVSAGGMKAVLSLLSDENSVVQRISLHNVFKYVENRVFRDALVEGGAFEVIVPLLSSQSPEILVDLMKLLSRLIEKGSGAERGGSNEFVGFDGACLAQLLKAGAVEALLSLLSYKSYEIQSVSVGILCALIEYPEIREKLIKEVDVAPFLRLLADHRCKFKSNLASILIHVVNSSPEKRVEFVSVGGIEVLVGQLSTSKRVGWWELLRILEKLSESRSSRDKFLGGGFLGLLKNEFFQNEDLLLNIVMNLSRYSIHERLVVEGITRFLLYLLPSKSSMIRANVLAVLNNFGLSTPNLLIVIGVITEFMKSLSKDGRKSLVLSRSIGALLEMLSAADSTVTDSSLRFSLLKLFKALALNDVIKAKMIDLGAADVLMNVLTERSHVSESKEKSLIGEGSESQDSNAESSESEDSDSDSSGDEFSCLQEGGPKRLGQVEDCLSEVGLAEEVQCPRLYGDGKVERCAASTLGRLVLGAGNAEKVVRASMVPLLLGLVRYSNKRLPKTVAYVLRNASISAGSQARLLSKGGRKIADYLRGMLSNSGSNAGGYVFAAIFLLAQSINTIAGFLERAKSGQVSRGDDVSTLDFSTLSLGSGQVLRLCDYLRSSSTLNRLILAKVPLSKDDGGALCKAVSRNNSLASLDVSNTGLSKAIIRELKRLSRRPKEGAFKLICDPAQTSSLFMVKATKVPEAYLCKLGRVLMKDPVLCNGKVYERRAIEGWFSEYRTLPGTGRAAQEISLVPCEGIKAGIRQFLMDHSESWGSDEVRLSEREIQSLIAPDRAVLPEERDRTASRMGLE